MHQLVEALLVSVLVVNFFVLGTSRLNAVIHASAVEGVLLGATLLCLRRDWEALALASGVIVIKGVVIPALLRGAMREVAIRREVEPFVGFTTSLLLGALATGLALLFAGTLPLAPAQAGTLFVPTALATVLTGFLVLTTRRKAISQAVGYLVLENGVFLMGLTLARALPLVVELGVLLDLLMGVLVIGIIINHINRELSSVEMDTAKLSSLQD